MDPHKPLSMWPKGQIPWTDNSVHITDDFCTERRIQETIKFIWPIDTVGRVIDISEPNYVGHQLEEYFGIKLDHPTITPTTDFNWGILASSQKYDTVFCFEVLEHIMNPAMFVGAILKMLKPRGVLYLSTPVHNPCGFFFNRTCHFAEYKPESVAVLLGYTGFYVTEYHTFRSIPYWQGLRHGAGLFRGSLRMMTQRTQLLRAVA